MKVAIIGAGPAGLVTCKTLLESATEDFPFDPIIFEQEADLGGTFQYRSYENSDLVSSKQLTAFSDFRLPLDHPDHLSLPRYVQYLREYAHKFNVAPRINYNSRVVRIARDTNNPKGGHLVSYIKKNLSTGEWDTTPTVIHASHIAMCTGLHVVPHIPSIPGIENVLNRPPRVKADGTVVKPAVYHSSKYKRRSELTGKRVLILGTGETGLDLAYESAKGGAEEAVLCTRVGFLSIPKALNDFEVFGMPFKSKRPLPIDTLITNLAETAYVHPWIAESRIRWFISDFVLKRVLCFLTGTHAGCNQWVGELPPEKLGRAFVALNKSHKALPYINRPYRKRPAWMEKVARYIDPPEDMPPITNFTVDFAPFPESFDKDGRVIFPESTRKDAVRMRNRDIRPDTVIFATGYTQDFSLFDPEGKYPTASDADIRDVVRSGDETVAFIGFLRPGIGAIPPIAEMQSFFWVSLLKGQVQRPLSPPHYHLLVKKTARVRYAVDHGAYMSTLARDIGAAPGLWELFTEHGLHVLVCYCFGAAFTTFYRLVGPFRSAQAPDIVKTELWETVTRRGFWGNFLMGFIPMVFWIIVNALAYGIDLVWTAAGRPNLLGRK